MQKQASQLCRWAVVATLGLAGAAAGCGANNPTGPSARNRTGSSGAPQLADGHAGPAGSAVSETPGVTVQNDGAFPVGPELAAVRRATAPFHDVAVARAAGYTTENEPCVASPEGIMGVHAPNFALIGDPAIDPLRPELLLYLPGPGGQLRLIGVEYFQVVMLRNPATGVVAPWVDPGPWPTTYEVVNPTPTLFGQTFDGPMPGHNPTMPWHWDFHVWIWAHNPSGIFAEWNPSLHCS